MQDILHALTPSGIALVAIGLIVDFSVLGLILYDFFHWRRRQEKQRLQWLYRPRIVFAMVLSIFTFLLVLNRIIMALAELHYLPSSIVPIFTSIGILSTLLLSILCMCVYVFYKRE